MLVQQQENSVVVTPFRAGYSGNPSGRPRKDRELKTFARGHTKAAVEALVAALQDRRTRVTAACALLDRGWGKPRTQGDSTSSIYEVQTVYLLPGDDRI
jgi:hypothetical protein